MPEFVGIYVGDQQPRLATLLLGREPTNALTRQVYRELAEAATEVSRRADIAAVILFGGHEIFSAGDDMTELRTLDRAEAQAADRVRRGRWTLSPRSPSRPSQRSPVTRWVPD